MFTGANHPSTDEVEIVVFGPGYGESIVVHVGDGDWIIVDSCHDKDKKPVAQIYLDLIGVAPEKVKYIVVSHWHDDHTRGISALAKYYSSARIGVSNILNTQEGKFFAAAYSGEVAKLTRGTEELYKIFSEQKGRIDSLGQNTIVLEYGTGPAKGLIRALSPTSECFLEAQKQIQQALPRRGEPSPVKEAPHLSPNNEAVAIHIDTGRFAILLGSDLETNQHGWNTIVAHPTCATLTRADFYKVAHHGSMTAEAAGIWTGLLHPSPVSVLTPYNNGGTKLPKDSDKLRIKAKSLNLHTSSTATTKPAMASTIVRRLEVLGSTPIPINPTLGAVRSRKSLASVDGASGWNFHYFGAAARLT